MDYLFAEFKGKAMCLVCLHTCQVMKDYNLSRHYSSSAGHKDKYSKYTGDARAAIVADLKSKVKSQQSLFAKVTTVQESSLNASYAVSLELAKSKKPLSDGETVKKCAIVMAKSFGNDAMVKNFETVSLSRRTVTRRIFDIQNHVEEKLKKVMDECSYYSLALDESTDVTDVSQLLIYARAINSSFEVHEELLKLASLHDTTKGVDIFNAVQTAVQGYGGFDKLSAVVTDGAPAMKGKHTGFAGASKAEWCAVSNPALHYTPGKFANIGLRLFCVTNNYQFQMRV